MENKSDMNAGTFGMSIYLSAWLWLVYAAKATLPWYANYMAYILFAVFFAGIAVLAGLAVVAIAIGIAALLK